MAVSCFLLFFLLFFDTVDNVLVEFATGEPIYSRPMQRGRHVSRRSSLPRLGPAI